MSSSLTMSPGQMTIPGLWEVFQSSRLNTATATQQELGKYFENGGAETSGMETVS